MKTFPVIDLVATGENILRLRKARGLSVRDLQEWFGFEEPQAIYKWQRGKSLPTVDNLYALGALLNVPMEEILVPCTPKLNMVANGQQAETCCPSAFYIIVGVVAIDRLYNAKCKISLSSRGSAASRGISRLPSA